MEPEAITWFPSTAPASNALGLVDSPPSAPTPSISTETVRQCQFKWAGKLYGPLELAQSETIGDLREKIWSIVNVPPSRQKILGLGKLPEDHVSVASLDLGKQGKIKEFMVIGTPVGEEAMGNSSGALEEGSPELDYTPDQIQAFKAQQSIRNQRKLKEATAAVEIHEMSPSRPGKRLLVLDLDYCILDTGKWKEANFHAIDFMRPFLHEFLRAISPFYDIVIWSQTSWRWLESKLQELGLVGGSVEYPIVFVLDRKPMFSVYADVLKDGKPFKHEVKALGIIWSKFKNYSALNTIHVDDLARNFAMNPANGLRVHAYKNSKRATGDRELLFVSRYLLQLALVPDFTKLDHKNFRTCSLPLPPGVEDPKP